MACCSSRCPGPSRIGSCGSRSAGRSNGTHPLDDHERHLPRVAGGPATLEAIGGWMSLPATFEDGGEPERIRIARLTPSLHRAEAGALAGRVFDAADAATPPGERAAPLARLLAAALRRRSRHRGAHRAPRLPAVYRHRRHAVGVRVSRSRNAGVDSRPHHTDVQRRRGSHLAPDLRCRGADASRCHAATGCSRRHGARTDDPRSRPGCPRAVRQRGATDDCRHAGPRSGGRGGAAGRATSSSAAVLLLFATAVGSVATVQLARAAARRREMTVRAALGASRGG